MLIPAYWSEAVLRVKRPGARHEKVIRRWGWSSVSQDEAQAHAQARATAAELVFLTGGDVPHREAQHEYPAQDGLPIREEVVDHVGASVVTRNGYGALCLNTPNVLFADIDDPLPPPPSAGWRWLGLALLLLAGLGLLRGWPAGPWALGAWLGHMAFQRIHRSREKKRFPGRALAWSRVTEFADKHPDWHLRIYETPRGLRALVMHRTFDPRDPETAQALSELSNDALFQRLCARQQCFRARVSPKPWRIPGMGSSRPPRRLWPLAGKRLEEHRQWVQRYTEASTGFAACRFARAIGPEVVCPEAEAVRALHDRLSRALAGAPDAPLPLA